jgi:hypothetical protein
VEKAKQYRRNRWLKEGKEYLWDNVFDNWEEINNIGESERGFKIEVIVTSLHLHSRLLAD